MKGRKIFLLILLVFICIIAATSIKTKYSNAEVTKVDPVKSNNTITKNRLDSNIEKIAGFSTVDNEIDINKYRQNYTANVEKLSEEVLNFKQYKEQYKDNGFTSDVIDDNRVVRVVKIHFPSGISFKYGFAENAVVTVLYDAETRKVLSSTYMSLNPNGMKTKSRKDLKNPN